MSTPAVPPPADRPQWLPDTPSSLAAERAAHPDPGPTPDLILAAYSWGQVAVCIQCRQHRWTARIAQVISPSPHASPHAVLMCGPCILQAEERRRLSAAEHGIPYRAGRIGRSR